jgi:hypothetical protein
MKITVNLVLSFLFGVFLKIYDDIIDNKLNIKYINFLKFFVITLFSILFYNDVVFTILWFLMAFVSFIMDKYYTSKLETSKDTIEQKDFTCMNEDTWLYSLILSGLFIIYHFFVNLRNKRFIITDYKNITFIINIIINIIIVVADIYFTPEHASEKKLYARIGVLIALSFFVYFMSKFSQYIYEGNYGIMLMNIGFLIGSICFLTMDKFHVFDKFKNKDDIDISGNNNL